MTVPVVYPLYPAPPDPKQYEAPILRFRSGRGRFVTNMQGAQNVTLQTLEQEPPQPWQRVVHISANPNVVDFSAAGSHTLSASGATGGQISVETAVGGGGAVLVLAQTDVGIEVEIEPDVELVFGFVISDVLPGYVLGQKIRMVVEWSTPANLGALANDSGVGVAYGDSVSAPTVLEGALNALSGGDIYRQYIGIAPTAGFEVSSGVVVPLADAILASEFAHPGSQAFGSQTPTTFFDWDTDVASVDDIYAIEGPDLLPSGPGTSLNAATDVMLVRIANNVASGVNLVGTIKAISLYALAESLP